MLVGSGGSGKSWMAKQIVQIMSHHAKNHGCRQISRGHISTRTIKTCSGAAAKQWVSPT